MVNLVRVKRKRGLPSPAESLYVDVNDGRSADNLIEGLSLSGNGNGGNGSNGRPPRTKRYRRIVGNMTLIEFEAQEFRDGFERETLGADVEAGGSTQQGASEANEEAETRSTAIDDSNQTKRKASAMTYAVVKRRREAASSPTDAVGPAVGPAGPANGDLDLDPLRRLGVTYRVCDLEFTPATPDVKSRSEDGDGVFEDLYDLYVEDDDWQPVEDSSRDVTSCAVVYVDDCDFFIPEFDMDREPSSSFDSEDSNDEGYFMNDYPDEDDDDDDDDERDDDAELLGKIGGRWDDSDYDHGSRDSDDFDDLDDVDDLSDFDDYS